MEGRPLAMGLAIHDRDVPLMNCPRATPAVTRMSLADALALGSDAWDALFARGTSPSPFMSWAWHRAWADSAPPEEVEASRVLLLHGVDGSLHIVTRKAWLTLSADAAELRNQIENSPGSSWRPVCPQKSRAVFG